MAMEKCRRVMLSWVEEFTRRHQASFRLHYSALDAPAKNNLYNRKIKNIQQREFRRGHPPTY